MFSFFSQQRISKVAVRTDGGSLITLSLRLIRVGGSRSPRGEHFFFGETRIFCKYGCLFVHYRGPGRAHKVGCALICSRSLRRSRKAGSNNPSRSLPQEDIPAKLRCAICSKLAVNAFRLPCCEQAICEDCQSTLPASCPVCEHSPLSADDCKPHKSLRTTIKVFLRTEEKKREASRSKETPPVTPVEANPPQPTPPAAVPTPAPVSAELPTPVDGAISAKEDQPAEEASAPESALAAGEDRENGKAGNDDAAMNPEVGSLFSVS